MVQNFKRKAISTKLRKLCGSFEKYRFYIDQLTKKLKLSEVAQSGALNLRLAALVRTRLTVNPSPRVNNHCRVHLCKCALWQYGLWNFQAGGTKLERFLPKNQHTKRKLLNFENWINGGLRSFQKSEF